MGLAQSPRRGAAGWRGLLRDGWIEIRSGLAAGEAVVSRGHSELIDGSRIVARNPDGTLAVSAGAAGDDRAGGEL